MQQLIDRAKRSVTQLEAEREILDPLVDAVAATSGAQGEVCALDVDHMDIKGLHRFLQQAEKAKASTTLSARGVALLGFAHLVLGMRRAVQLQDLHRLQDLLIEFRSFNSSSSESGSSNNTHAVCKVCCSCLLGWNGLVLCVCLPLQLDRIKHCCLL
jgi:hypothetical protein